MRILIYAALVFGISQGDPVSSLQFCGSSSFSARIGFELLENWRDRSVGHACLVLGHPNTGLRQTPEGRPLLERQEAMASTDVQNPEQAPVRFVGTRLAILVILAGLWFMAIFEWDNFAYKTTILASSPYPSIVLKIREPRFGIGRPKEQICHRSVVLWERTPNPNKPLYFFLSKGTEGERAIRVAYRNGSPNLFTTLGYVIELRDTNWKWLAGVSAQTIEDANRERGLRNHGETRARPALQPGD